MANQLRNRNNLASSENINHQLKFEKSLDLLLGNLQKSPDLATKSLNWQHWMQICTATWLQNARNSKHILRHCQQINLKNSKQKKTDKNRLKTNK